MTLAVEGEGAPYCVPLNLEDEPARLHAVLVLMKHYSAEDFSAASFSPKALSLTCVVKVSVDSWSGKRLVRP